MIEIQLKGLPPVADEAIIQTWLHEEGDAVSGGDDLVEISVEGDALMIKVPKNGILTEVYFDEGETVRRDEVICLIDDEEET